jgi:5-formyltetrahydrofolate cyclo-ligase
MKTISNQNALKTRLRAALRKRRSELAEDHRTNLDTAINRHLVDYVQQGGYRCVAAFLAFDGEPNLEPSLRVLEQAGVELALPVVNDLPGRSGITFQKWTGDCVLQSNRFGIMEPAGTPDIPLIRVDLSLIPLVGWDRAGGRLGMGGSFYDRLFQPLSDDRRPLRVGVAYALQELDEVPLEPWDIRLHAVLTENGWFTCEG